MRPYSSIVYFFGNIEYIARDEIQEGLSVHYLKLPAHDKNNKCLHYLKHGARWIMIAALAGQTTQIDLKNIYVRNVRVIGRTLRSRTPEFKAQLLAKLVEDVWPRGEQGPVKPTMYAELPIANAEEAHAILESCKHVGKVVLKV
jgi:NADPH2:quinone reductase